MRILIASDLHWPTMNGVATFGRNLAHGLAARGHEVLVIAPSQTGKRYQEIDRNHRVARTTSLTFPFYQKNFRISVSPYSEVKSIIQNFKPDVIHIQSPLGIGRAAIGAGKKMGIPVVATNHSMPENLIENLKLLAPFARPISYILKEYGERFHRNADYVTMPTQAAIDMFNSNTSTLKVPLAAVSCGIDLSEYKPGPVAKDFRERYGLNKDKPVVLYVGRLDSEKHLYVLLRAFTLLLEKMDAQLVMVGHGNDAENLQQLARELRITDKTIFAGRVSDEDKYMFYRCGTVFAMPSPAELQSIVVLEAMATGLPVVAVNAGALYELCQDGRNGFLTEADNDVMMAEKLLEILQDKTMQNRMAEESLKIAKTHDITHTIDRFEHIYKEVITAHALEVEASRVSV